MPDARNGDNGGGGRFLFDELWKQAAAFLHGELRAATPAQLLTEEATDGGGSSPADAWMLSFISRAAFDADDYFRIVEIVHKRLSRFDKKLWREAYKALILLEHLLTHGPEIVAGEFRRDGEVIRAMGNLQYIDEKGFNWGPTVKRKSERVLELLENASVLAEKRKMAWKVTGEIQGFGSFKCYSQSNSQYESCSTVEDSESNDEQEVLNPKLSVNWKAEFIDPENGSEMDESQPLLPHQEKPEDHVPEISLNWSRKVDKQKSDDHREIPTPDMPAKWKAEFRDTEVISHDHGSEMDESQPFLPHQEEPKDVSEISLNWSRKVNKQKSDDHQEIPTRGMPAKWKAEFGDPEGSSCDNGSETDESELFLPNQGEPKKDVSEKRQNCSTQMNKNCDHRQEIPTRNVSAQWKAEFKDSQQISCDNGSETDESYPFLPNQEERKMGVPERYLNWNAKWKSEFRGTERISCNKGSEMDESEPFFPREEEPKKDVSQKSMYCGTRMKKYSDHQKSLKFHLLETWKAEFGNSEGNSCGKGTEMDESELFLPQEADRKIDASERGLNCNLQTNKKSEFKVWPHECMVFPTIEAVIDESEPFLPRGEEKRINKTEKSDHHFNLMHRGREPVLVLGQI